MVDYRQAKFDKLSVHYVGNKQKQENLTLSDSTYQLNDELLEEILKKYFLHPLKGEELFAFMDMNSAVAACAKKIFESPADFHKQSVQLAEWLYECGKHPRIKGGEFYIAYLSDCFLDDEVVDAIGIFKSETKDTFLKVYPKKQGTEIKVDEGININKLDKGCIIYNTAAEDGYRAAMIDTNSKVQEAALYWKTDFLGLQMVDNEYSSTVNYMDLVKNFSQDYLSRENNVPKEEQLQFLKKSNDFFMEKENFDFEEFKKEVIIEPEMSNAFLEYKEAFEDEKALPVMDNFNISPRAVEKNSQRFFRSVIKLDKNFHLYVHGNADYIERGFDVERSLNFYKLYFRDEA